MDTPPALEAQSSFAEDEGGQAQARGPARFEADEVMEDAEEAKRGAFSEMFECHIKNLIEFVDKKQQSRMHPQKDVLNDIILYIQDESDFYQAWENVFSSQVDGYQNDEDGERYPASQTTWICTLPEVLTFQMQRTEFIAGQVAKKQHKHPILPVIHPDRFMLKNQQAVQAIRKKVDLLRRKIQFLKDCLARYTNFDQSGLALDTALGAALKYFSA